VYEISGDYIKARDSFEMVIQDEPENTKVLMQLGFIHSIPDSRIRDLDKAQTYIDKALNIGMLVIPGPADDSEPKDASAWYYLGRYYMQRLNYSKAYEAYQQAVYRDSRNSNFWCSIGVLYWEINQFRDALDAYTRAIRLNPYIPEIWFNLGTLYEACNNQIQDAIDAYNRAWELDNSYSAVEERLNVLKRNIETGRNDGPPPPRPSDIDPQRYEDFLQSQQNQQNQQQLQSFPSSWGPTAGPGGAPISQHRGQPMHQPPPPQHPQYPPRRSPDQLKTVPYTHPPPSNYPNGSSGYVRPPPAPPISVKRGSSPSPYGYDRPPMSDPPHHSYPRHEEMHRHHAPPTQSYASPRQHERDLGGPGGIGGSAPFPPPASRSPVYYNRVRSPPPQAPMAQHGPPPEVKPALDQGPPPSPGNSHNVQLAPLHHGNSPPTTRSPQNIPPVPRNDAAAYPLPSEPKRREWETEYNRGESSRSPHPRVDSIRPEEHRISQEHQERRAPSQDRRASPHPHPPRPRSPLISPRTAEPSYVPPVPVDHKSPSGEVPGTKMEIDSPGDKSDPLPPSRNEEPEKMQIEEDQRPEVEAPARAMEVDEDYDKEEEKPDED
jgi:glucose repression mediator protein